VSARLKVLVVDDSPTARRMLHLVLDELPGLSVVGEAFSGEDCLATIDALAPQLVVMDWQMPGMNGAETTEALLARHPEVRVIGFTSSADVLTHQAFLDAGAEAVFAKERALDLRDYLGGLVHR
jgi:two-component system chemotaxis response regulator CheB